MSSMGVPDSVSKAVREAFPGVYIRWDERNRRFQVFERQPDRPGGDLLLWVYENDDGTRMPIIADTVVNFLHRADTRKWPMADRLAFMEKARRERLEQREREFSNQVQSAFLEDYNYIAGIKSFFYGPGMKQARSTYTPAQEEILRARGLR